MNLITRVLSLMVGIAAIFGAGVALDNDRAVQAARAGTTLTCALSSGEIAPGDQLKVECFIDGLDPGEKLELALTYRDGGTGDEIHQSERDEFVAQTISLERCWAVRVPAALSNLHAGPDGIVFVGLWSSSQQPLAHTSFFPVTFSVAAPEPPSHCPTASEPTQQAPSEDPVVLPPTRKDRCEDRVRACLNEHGWFGDLFCSVGDVFTCEIGGTIFHIGETVYKNVKRLALECGATEGTTANKIWRIQKGFWAGFAVQSDDPCMAYGEEWSAFTVVGDVADASGCITQGCGFKELGGLIAGAGPLPPWKKIKQLDDLAKRIADSPLDEMVRRNPGAADDFRRLKTKIDSDCPVKPDGRQCLGAVHEYDANAYLSSLPDEEITRIPRNQLPNSDPLKRTVPGTNKRVISDGESKYGPNGKFKNVTEVRPTGNHGPRYFEPRMRAAKDDGVDCFTIFIYEGAGGSLPKNLWETRIREAASEAGIGLRILDMPRQGGITPRGTSTCPGK